MKHMPKYYWSIFKNRQRFRVNKLRLKIAHALMLAAVQADMDLVEKSMFRYVHNHYQKFIEWEQLQ